MKIFKIFTKVRKKEEINKKDKEFSGYSVVLSSTYAPLNGGSEALANDLIYKYYLSSHLLYSVISVLREASLQVGVEFNKNINEKWHNNIIKKLPLIYTDMYLYSGAYFDRKGNYIEAHKVRYHAGKKKYIYRDGNGEKVAIKISIRDGVSPVVSCRDVIEKSIFLDIKEKESIINWGGDGILVNDTNDGYGLTSDEIEMLNKKFKELRSTQGAGGIILLGKKFGYQRVGLTPSEANSEKIYVNISRQIANTFGIDSSLLNDYANKTYSNKTESYRGLYVNVVLPIVENFWKYFYAEFKGGGVIPASISMEDFVNIDTKKIFYLQNT